MKEQFVPYNPSIQIKELGFNERCVAHWYSLWKEKALYIDDRFANDQNQMKNGEKILCLAPLWQQAFDWFREKYKLDSFYRSIEDTGKSYWKISKLYDDGNIKGYSGFSNSIQEARLVCLNKLIEICKK